MSSGGLGEREDGAEEKKEERLPALSGRCSDITDEPGAVVLASTRATAVALADAVVVQPTPIVDVEADALLVALSAAAPSDADPVAAPLGTAAPSSAAIVAAPSPAVSSGFFLGGGGETSFFGKTSFWGGGGPTFYPSSRLQSTH